MAGDLGASVGDVHRKHMYKGTGPSVTTVDRQNAAPWTTDWHTRLVGMLQSHEVLTVDLDAWGGHLPRCRIQGLKCCDPNHVLHQWVLPSML